MTKNPGATDSEVLLVDFTEPVDFYITSDASVNAFSLAFEDKGEPHIVNVNSALFDLMT